MVCTDTCCLRRDQMGVSGVAGDARTPAVAGCVWWLSRSQWRVSLACACFVPHPASPCLPPPPPGPPHPPTHPPSCRYNKLLSDLHTAAEAAAQQSGQARPQVDPQLSLFADTFLAQLLHPEMAAQAVEVSRAGGEGGGRADGGSQQQVTALRKLCRTAYVLHQRRPAQC